jgi:putative nucleotidyltransferase with HDIG domain/PAS domain S-box-containing protein
MDASIQNMKDRNKSIEKIIAEIVDQGIMDAIGDGISIQDIRLKILYQNRIHKDLFGEHIGEYCYDAYECSNHNGKECPLELSFHDAKTHAEEREVHTGKGIFHVEITASPLRNITGEVIGGIEVVRDITERKQTEERKQIVYEFTRNVSAHPDLHYRLHEICATVVQLGYKMVWVGLLDEHTKEVIPKAQAGFESGYLSTIKVKYNESPLGQGPTGRAIKNKQPISQNNITTDPRYAPWREHAIQRGYRSSAAFPIIEDDDVAGVLNVYNTDDEFPDDDIGFLQSFANLCASYIKNAELVASLQELLLGTVNALSETITAKSQWTSGHLDRVRSIAISIGKEMGLNEKELKNLELGSVLHDIGKIGTYEAILNKPEELTKDEFDVIKLHAGKGAEMLSTIKQLKEIVPSIKYHHERYDGGGYPDGLKGEEIPILSRILCVADTVDSMLSDRPYRKGMAMKEIVAELRNGSGTQFDPLVIDAFLKTLK